MKRALTPARCAALGTAAALCVTSATYWFYVRPPLVEVFSAPTRFTRRQGEFTVNICGITSRALAFAEQRFRYRVNDGPWHPIGMDYPRTHSRHFRLELADAQLNDGPNEVWIEADAFGLALHRRRLHFTYDRSLPELPAVVDWADPALEVEDGRWERFRSRGGQWRVRPRPGHEGYDRMLVVTGSFPRGRRVRTDVVFRYALDGRPFGFGIVPMWGGRPDDRAPRRGWNLSLVWYWNRYEGFGSEFSYKHGDRAVSWVNSYRYMPLEPNRRYNVLAEAWPEHDARGRHLRYRQRVKWWPRGEPEPSEWLVTGDDEGAALPAGEFGVALIAYWSQADFGPVQVEPIEPVVVVEPEASLSDATAQREDLPR